MWRSPLVVQWARSRHKPMSERINAYVHTEGDPSDVLFQLPPMGRELREGDTFTFTPVSGPSVVYKVEKSIIKSRSWHLAMSIIHMITGRRQRSIMAFPWCLHDKKPNSITYSVT
jgi:hypothetical protein